MIIRVLINAVHTKSGGGVTYLRNILPLLTAMPDLDIHVAIQAGHETLLPPDLKRIKVHVLPALSRLATVLWQEQVTIPALARAVQAHVVFSPANYGPLWGRHNVIMLRNSLEVAEIDPRLTKRLYWLAVKVLSYLSFRTCRRAITVSRHAGDGFLAAFDMGPDSRLEVVHHGVSPLFQPPANDSARRKHRLLAVSDLYVQKNLETAIEAVALLAAEFGDVALDIAGRTLDDGYGQKLEQLCAERGLSQRVTFLGGQSAEAIASLYAQADVFVFPSVVETFGNPVLEALASGLPVVCSDTAAMPEVAGNAALYAAPRNPAAMASQIAALFRDHALWQTHSNRGKARAADFTWHRTAHSTAAILRAVARE